MKPVRLIPSVFCFSFAACGDSATTIDGPSAIDAQPATKIVEVTLLNPPADLAAAGLVFAYQDGDGAWQKTSAAIGDKITFQVANDKFGFAADCSTGIEHDITVQYATQSSTPSLALRLGGCSAPTAVTLPGLLSGTLASLGDRAHTISFANRRIHKNTATAESSLAYSLPVPSTTADIILSRRELNDGVFDRFAVERNVAVGATPVSKQFDFNSLAAPELVLQPAPLQGNSVLFGVYFTATSQQSYVDSTPPLYIVAPPLAQRLSTDKVEVSLYHLDDNLTSSVEIDKVMATQQPVTLPDNVLGSITVTTPGTDKTKVSWQPISNPNARYYSSLSFGCGDRCSVSLTADFTPQWLGNIAPVVWTTPELSIFGIAPLSYGSVQVTAAVAVGSYPNVGYEYQAHTKGANFTMQSKPTSGVSRVDRLLHICHGHRADHAICKPQ